MQPCNTGDQPYSDASPNGECSLMHLIYFQNTAMWYKAVVDKEYCLSGESITTYLRTGL